MFDRISQALRNLDWEAMEWEQLLMTWAERLLTILIIFVLARLLQKAGQRVIDEYFKKKTAGLLTEERKAHTLQPLFKQIWHYLVAVMALLIILDQLGVKLTALLATAGVAGIAIGFGAQRLVRDIITGFLLLMEDQYAVGDLITVNNFVGVVEEVGLRVTKLRDFSGDLHIIPNGNIEIVTNHARGEIRAMVDVQVSYEADLDRAIQVLEELSAEMAAQYPEIVDGPTVLGVTDLAESGIVIRLIAHTEPLKQWYIERELRRAIKKRFDRENIEIPYPRRVIYHRQEETKPQGETERES
ncbi:MAG TPA: mechanosensitive ion channel family protein [Bacillota bacterium]|nr:mechanosensitive ion channel family protein [Bacillota bacterium]